MMTKPSLMVGLLTEKEREHCANAETTTLAQTLALLNKIPN